jgi:hypothetical protein
MKRPMPAMVESSEWTPVSRPCPCRICGATEGCSNRIDGEFVRCLTQPAERPLVTGGWLHPVGVRIRA